MGMFTSIRHPESKSEIQIKTGWDFCEWFNVGDTISWTPDEYSPGRHLDGAYEGYMDEWGDTWVAIKNCTVVEVVDTKDLPQDVKDDVYTFLCNKHNIENPDPSLWSEESWERRREMEKEAEARYERWAQQADAQGLTGIKKTSWILAQIMVGAGLRRNYAEIGRKAFIVEPLPAAGEESEQ